MTEIVLFLRKSWRFLFFLTGTLLFIAFYPFFFLFIMLLGNFSFAFRLIRWFSLIHFALLGIRWKVNNESKLPEGKPIIFCPNHTSYLDILVSYLVLPRFFLMVGKAELKKVPFFRIFFLKMNIPVERDKLRDSHRALIRAGEALDAGSSLVIFPEGGIQEPTPRLAPFKNGPFKLAIEKQVPVVPVTFLTNWAILPDGRKKRHGGRPGFARAVIHKPISTIGMTEIDVPRLRQSVFSIIDHCLRTENLSPANG